MALWMSDASIRSWTVIRSPARRLMDDSPIEAACGDTVTTSVGFVCSSATSTVISLVMLAIGSFCEGFGRQDVPVPPVGDEIGARLHARAGS